MKREDSEAMSPYTLPVQAHQHRPEGVAVVGEAVRRVSPESAEFLIEISATAPAAAQALRDSQMKTNQVAQAVGAVGVQATDLQTISMNVYHMYAPGLPGLTAYSHVPQIGHAGFTPYPAGSPVQPELQFGSYQARNIVRVNVREPMRAGEIADLAVKAGATIVGSFSFRVSDEASARRAALEAAGKDARVKAETLAAAAGKQVGEVIAITEEIVASNGSYAALRTALPFILGAATPGVAGELEYYARVSANFRFQ
jgi:uncharacterized protein YggE